MKHFSLSDLDWKDIGNGWSQAVVELAKGDSAVDPTKGEGNFYGPAKLTYNKTSSGIRVVKE